MTRQFNQKVQCSNCGCWTTAETGFSRWIREQPNLDSEDGIVCCDIDYIVHRYKSGHDRTVQCLMFIEVKTRGREPTRSQADTLLLIDQYLNNQRRTPTKGRSKRQADGRARKAFSLLNGCDVEARVYGGYLLQFEQTGPGDSAWIKWGTKRQIITPAQLGALLKFDLDPNTLKPWSARAHHPLRALPLFGDDQPGRASGEAH